MNKGLSFLISFLLVAGVCNAQGYRIIRSFSAPGANQGVAVDDNCFYGIGSQQITKYSKNGDSLVTWKEADSQLIRHFDGGIVVDGLLYCSQVP